MSAGYRPRRPMNRPRPPEETRTGQAARQRERFRRIAEAVPAQAVAERYGLKLDRQGFCRCPFHAEDTPSLKVYPGSGGFYCFGCGAGGDVVALTARLLGLRPLEAARRLDADFGLGVFGDEKPDNAPHSEARPGPGCRCGPEAARLEEIHAALGLIYHLPRPKPGQHVWAAVYAQILACADIMEEERIQLHEQEYIRRCRYDAGQPYNTKHVTTAGRAAGQPPTDAVHQRGISDQQRAVLACLQHPGSV